MPPTTYLPLFPESFLASIWAKEYEHFRKSPDAKELFQRLNDWAARRPQKETAAEGAFVGVFFKQTWGYRASGEGNNLEGHSCEPKYAIQRAGERGGTGAADLALGLFDRPGVEPIPQVLCEFKSVRSELDKPQRRKGNDRSPVKQCADYLREAQSALFGTEPVQPTWGIVSDMNEFRLYWRKKMPAQYQRFVIKPRPDDQSASLLANTDSAEFQRFLFWKIFQKDMLLTTGGPSPLERLITEQWVQERAIENEFYREYQSYRQKVYSTLVDANPNFKGTHGRLVRLTQRLLDRCIFILFCEDMGAALNFPPNILRNLLSSISMDPDYDPNDDIAWTKIKRLFTAMRDGSPFREHSINRFNGGLFAHEPDLENIHIPTHLFCAKRQGASPTSLTLSKQTLLFFSANYNFGVSGGTYERIIGSYTLGRIFEQSITELEFMEAEADGRPSIAELSKRKRDGVYYTPEWITKYIVEETVGAYLAERRTRLELDPLPEFSTEEVTNYKKARLSKKKDKRFNTERVEQYVDKLDKYAIDLDSVKVVDPACGSGAFLIEALDRLMSERRWLAAERERVTGEVTMFDIDSNNKNVLSKNIYGVDINEESIEITRLALWLHTALPDRPLTSLDHNIRCGNSLIDSGFYASHQESLFSIEQREQINVFSWKEAFPEVFNRTYGRAGFDCVVGNPPYVKLQHFRQVQPDVAQYLVEARLPDGQGPLYPSTQTQNFDLYLAFIDRGVSLLNEFGRMGYIAPNVWPLNEHGEGLRNELLRTRRLERWVDFRDFGVFEEAMTYTALQFFRGRPNPSISCMFVPDGELGALDWHHPSATIKYSDLPTDEAWFLLPARERELIDRLANTCLNLGEVASAIIVGIQTSADHIYHLERLGPGRYRYFPKKQKPPVDVAIEDKLMRPLITGEEAKRYQIPISSTFLLFPYDDADSRPKLFTRRQLEEQFPNGWNYLCFHEKELRARENSKMDLDEGWWGYNYPKNIDKQKLAKLGVAQTIPEMRVFFDKEGTFCFNNVRVNGILTDGENLSFFLMGILNSRVIDFVFRRKSKPKERRPSGAYFEANKQYIAPLPIPRVTDDNKTRVARMARQLQQLHSARRDTIQQLDRLLASDQMLPSPRSAKWIWADVKDVDYWTKNNPDGLKGRELKSWAKQKYDESLSIHLSRIAIMISFGDTMCASERDEELMFFVRDRCIISGVYLSSGEAPLILAQWRQKARDTYVSDSMNAAKIVERLLNLKTTENAALIEKIRRANLELETIEAQIRSAEQELDDYVYGLYDLSDQERQLVEKDTSLRWEARMPSPPKS